LAQTYNKLMCSLAFYTLFRVIFNLKHDFV